MKEKRKKERKVINYITEAKIGKHVINCKIINVSRDGGALIEIFSENYDHVLKSDEGKTIDLSFHYKEGGIQYNSKANIVRVLEGVKEKVIAVRFIPN